MADTNPETQPEIRTFTPEGIDLGISEKNANTEVARDPLDVLLEGVDPDGLTDEAMEDLVDQHPAVRASVESLQEARKVSVLAKTREIELVESIRDERQTVIDALKRRLGKTVESPEEKASREETERREKLAAIRNTITGEETDDELLKKFELTDEAGKMSENSVHSPLFKLDTKVAFRTYLKFAANYDAMEKAQMASGAPIRNAQQASVIRRDAHNAVAERVMTDLGLTFDESRRIVSKMRESQIPNSGESVTYSMLLRRGSKLADQYGGDAAWLAESQLSNLLPKHQINK